MEIWDRKKGFEDFLEKLRAGENHGGLMLFRRSVRSTNYGDQARLVTDFWLGEGRGWDWTNRIVYLPKSP